MSAVFSLDQVLTCTESATSEYLTTSQCLSALLGRSGRVKFILNVPRHTLYAHSSLARTMTSCKTHSMQNTSKLSPLLGRPDTIPAGKDTGVTLFTLTTHGNPLRYVTHWSAPPVSTLTHSRGSRKRSQSPDDMLEHRDTYG